MKFIQLKVNFNMNKYSILDNRVLFFENDTILENGEVVCLKRM